MECSCVMESCDGEQSKALVRSNPVARKIHKCTECGFLIKKGETYEYYKCAHDDGITVYKTCINCLSLRDQFFTSGYTLTGLWEDFYINTDSFDCEIPEECISKLTPQARAKACKIIEDCWDFRERRKKMLS